MGNKPEIAQLPTTETITDTRDVAQPIKEDEVMAYFWAVCSEIKHTPISTIPDIENSFHQEIRGAVEDFMHEVQEDLNSAPSAAGDYVLMAALTWQSLITDLLLQRDMLLEN